MKRNKYASPDPREPKICPSCGAENDERLIFCRRCGARLKTFDEKQKIVVSLRKKNSAPLAGGTVFRFALILLIAIATTVFAFLPVSVMKTSNPTIEAVFEDELEVGFTTLDYVGFFVESLIPDPEKIENQKDAKDIAEAKADLLKRIDKLLDDASDDLTDEIESIVKDSRDDNEEIKLSPRAKRLFGRVARLGIHREMISVSAGIPPITIAVAGIAALYFILLCLVLLLRAIRNLRAYLRGKAPRFDKAMSRICFVLAFIPVMFFTQCAALNGITLSLSIFSIISMAICAFVVLYVAIEGAIRFKGEGMSAGTLIRKAIIILLCTVVMVSVFIPTVSFVTNTTLAGESKAEDVSIGLTAFDFGYLDNTHNEFADYTDLAFEDRNEAIEFALRALKMMTDDSVENGNAKFIGGIIMSNVLLGHEDSKTFNVIYSAVPLMNTLVMLFAAIIIAQLLLSLSTRNFKRGLTAFSRFLMIPLALLTLAAVIAAVVLFFINVDTLGADNIALYIGAGNIVMAVSAIASAFFSLRVVKKVYVGEYGEGMEN